MKQNVNTNNRSIEFIFEDTNKIDKPLGRSEKKKGNTNNL